MASAISPLNTASAAPASASSTTAAASTAASNPVNEQVFLQLLVSQIKNQDPLNPTDGTQFVSQLAQFSELEQVIAIRGDTDNMASQISSAPTAGAASGGATVSATGPSTGTNSTATTPATGTTHAVGTNSKTTN